MMSAEVKVDGLRQLVRTLREADTAAPQEIRRVNQESAAIVAETARGGAPVGPTGRLAGSIRAGATQRSGVVRAGRASVPYAGPINYGWPRRHIEANLFLNKALSQNIPRIVQGYVDALQKVVDQVEGV